MPNSRSDLRRYDWFFGLTEKLVVEYGAPPCPNFVGVFFLPTLTQGSRGEKKDPNEVGARRRPDFYVIFMTYFCRRLTLTYFFSWNF